jgi:hypothetical protein
MPEKINQEICKQICDLYLSGEKGTDLNKKFNLNIKTVYKILDREGIKIRSSEDSKRKFNFNENYFDKIDCARKAYWLGFIAGDGGIVKNCLRFNLSKLDINILKQFKQDLNSEHKIEQYSENIVSFSLVSKKLKQSLAKWEIYPAKSKTLSLCSEIPDQFINHYLLGLFDADGCFSVDKIRGIRYCMIGSTVSMLQIQEILIKKCGVNKVALHSHESESISQLHYSGNLQVKKIVDFLYQNLDICLDRKFKIASTFYKLENPNNYVAL